MAKKPLNTNTGIVLVITYFILLLVNSLIVYTASLVFPQNVELGTHELTPIFAVLLSMGILSLIGTFAIPFVRIYENMRGKMFNNMEWTVLYFVLNAAGIWVIARFAFQLGFGISSFVVAITLGFVLDFFQGVAMMKVEKMKK